MQAVLANFIYSKRTEAVYAKGQEALLFLREENKKLFAELKVASSKADILSEMVELATNSLRQTAEFRKSRDEELAKLKEELYKERELREEAWKTIEHERRVHEEGLLSEKAIFDAALLEEKGLRKMAETRI